MNQNHYSISGTLQELRDGYQRSLLQEQAAAANLELLSFSIGTMLCGCEMSALARVLPLRRILPLPVPHPSVRGLMNYSGSIIAVIDPSFLFDPSAPPLVHPQWILVCKGKDFLAGILVSTVVGMEQVAEDDLHQLPAVSDAGIPLAIRQGLVSSRGPMKFIDIPTVLALPELVVNQ